MTYILLIILIFRKIANGHVEIWFKSRPQLITELSILHNFWISDQWDKFDNLVRLFVDVTEINVLAYLKKSANELYPTYRKFMPQRWVVLYQYS